MKKISFIIIAVAMLTQACNKGIVNSIPEASSYANTGGLKYTEITGHYILFDSVHFVGNQAYQPNLPQFRHAINREVSFEIDQSTSPSASLKYNAQVYYESHTVANEYVTEDKYYDIQRIAFTKDSVFINYFRREYNNDSSLNISIKGYKL